METITIRVYRDDVYDEVAKATDYRGTKLSDGDEAVRDRILAADDDLATLGRFWEEAVLVVNERLKLMLVTGMTRSVPDDTGSEHPAYVALLEVSRSFDKELTESVQQAVRSFFIAQVVAQWFLLANKQEAADYLTQAQEMFDGAERLLYSRMRPRRPGK